MIRHIFQLLYSELKVSLVRLGHLTLARWVHCEGPMTDQLWHCCCNSSCSPYMSHIRFFLPEIPWPIHLTEELGFKIEKIGWKMTQSVELNGLPAELQVQEAAAGTFLVLMHCWNVLRQIASLQICPHLHWLTWQRGPSLPMHYKKSF